MKLLKLRSFLLCSFTVLMVGCVSNTKSIKEEKVAKWEPITKGSSIKVDTNYPYEMKLSNGRLLRQKNWNEYLKPFIKTYSQENADIIVDGLTRYWWAYDKVDKKIKFEPLRYMSEPYSRSKYVSMQGTIEKGRAIGLIKIKYYSSSWIFANRLKIVADGYTWESPELKFYRDNSGGNVWEYTFLNLSKQEHREVAEKISSAKETIIRFNGKQYFSDFTLPSRMKDDLKAMIKVIDVVNNK